MILSVDELEPGMILEEAVRTHQDQLLLEAGRRITARSIRVFKTWGIRRVAVRPPGERAGAAPSPPMPEDEDAILLRLKARSGQAAEDPVLKEILRAAARQIRAHRGEESR